MRRADRLYYYRRAEVELALAQAATHPAAARAHYHLAARYLDRVYGGRLAVRQAEQAEAPGVDGQSGFGGPAPRIPHFG